MGDEQEQGNVKWQPVMLVLNRRLECACGNLGIFITGVFMEGEEYNILEEVDVWCQQCFHKAQEEEEEQA